jgi:NAD(P)H-dependent FMN reductase
MEFISFKNVFDWCTRISGKVFQEKAMLLMASSPGAKGGASLKSLKKHFHFMVEISSYFSF